MKEGNNGSEFKKKKRNGIFFHLFVNYDIYNKGVNDKEERNLHTSMISPLGSIVNSRSSSTSYFTKTRLISSTNVM